MNHEPFSPEDHEVFVELNRAARFAGVTPYMIGAGAIQLGPARHWERRPRMTRDWDFAVRVASWDEFQALIDHLTGDQGSFEQAPEQHRVRHRNGRVLDIMRSDDSAASSREDALRRLRALRLGIEDSISLDD